MFAGQNADPGSKATDRRGEQRTGAHEQWQRDAQEPSRAGGSQRPPCAQRQPAGWQPRAARTLCSTIQRFCVRLPSGHPKPGVLASANHGVTSPRSSLREGGGRLPEHCLRPAPAPPLPRFPTESSGEL